MSHVLHMVDDLSRAVEDFRALGFAVEWGSDPRRAHNALIWFADGPFIELCHVPRWVARLAPVMRLARGPAVAERFGRWARADEGFCDLAVESDATDLAADHAALAAAGVATSRVLKGHRVRPDGTPVRYQFVLPRPVGLPFLVSDYVPPQRPHRVEHPNGARRIRRVEVDVAPGHRDGFAALAGDGPGPLVTTPAARTVVREVHVEGLSTPRGTTGYWHGGRYRVAAG